MRVQRQRKKSGMALPLKILLSIVVLVGASFSVAWVWHATEQTTLLEEEPAVRMEKPTSDRKPAESSASSSMSGSEGLSSSRAGNSGAEPSGASGEASAAVDAGAAEQTGLPAPPPVEVEEPDPAVAASPAVETPAGAVPENEPVDGSYFDDAIFFGDSITTGIPLYHLADNAAVVAFTGINPVNINSREVIENSEGQRVTILEAAKEHGPRKKVYIMLGGNGIGFDKQTFIDGYAQFVDSVRELYPDATIYLQSMTPVVHGYQNQFEKDFSNEKINEYNLEILALAKQKNVYYLDVASALRDETGALPAEASPVDGLHFSPEYYKKWFDYLKSHTVEDKI